MQQSQATSDRFGAYDKESPRASNFAAGGLRDPLGVAAKQRVWGLIVAT